MILDQNYHIHFDDRDAVVPGFGTKIMYYQYIREQYF